MMLLQAEMLDLKANPTRRASGYVVESRLESGMGPTATLLIKQGTLKVGDPVLCGSHWGKVKALIDARGVQVKEAGPSIPVKCLGLSGVPDAGARFRVCASDKVARNLTEKTIELLRLERVAAPKRASLDDLFDKLKQRNQLVELRLVLKTDVQGSLEAIHHGLNSIPSDKVSVNVILGGVGNITANDVMLASASEAVVVGFNVSTDAEVNAIAQKEGVEVRLFSIIYELLDEIRNSMTGLLAPLLSESVTGHAQVLQIFQISKLGSIAGCLLADGHAASRARARVKRANGVIYEGSVVGLRRFQNDVSEVKEGQECGVRLDNFGAFQKDDIIEFYELKKVAQTV